MVQSSAATVDDYMATVEPERLEVMTRLRDACRTHLTGWEERMAWGMPGYGPPGSDPMISINSQKRHIALYAGARAIAAAGDRLKVKGVDCGKGCIRYGSPKAMDFAVIDDILRDVRQNGRGACE